MALTSLRTFAANDPTMLPGLLSWDIKLVRDQVEALYRKHRSGRSVAAAIGINFRTMKRWLQKFEELGIPIPETSKGNYEERDARLEACTPFGKPLKTRAKKKRSKKG